MDHVAVSWTALAWAARCRVSHATDKLVLLGLAERHNEEAGGAYPSVDWLAEFGSLNRKTVITSLDRLETAGLIADSGDRAGKTKQVKVYRLAIGTVPKAEQSQKRNGTVFSVKQSQKRDTDTIREPLTPVGSSEPTAPPIQNGIAVQHLQEAWNTIAASRGAVLCKSIGPERRRKAVPFLKRYHVEDITEAITAVGRSDFLCGRGSKSFRADIEFLFSAKHMNRLLEGFYDAG